MQHCTRSIASLAKLPQLGGQPRGWSYLGLQGSLYLVKSLSKLWNKPCWKGAKVV